MGVDGFWYDLCLLLHLVCVIVGFGGVTLNGVYAARARGLAPDHGLAVMEVNSFVSMRVAEVFIYLVPVFGLGLVGLSDGVIGFGELWVWLSLVIYLVALGVSHAVLMPAVKEMLGVQRELVSVGAPAAGPPPQAERLAALGQRIGATSTVLHLALVAVLVLMVWKPGG